MTPDLIRQKRDGEALTEDAIRRFVEGVTDGNVDDAQLGAFLMAVYLNGMSDQEQAALTLAMRDSGEVMQWPDLPGPVLDKHSTGGVGDLVSLVLAPLVAACGGYVPMISGRGLGHTGGTLDKLESIPGFDVTPGRVVFEQTVREAGFAMVGQGDDLAPADRRMYATRDVTATVACAPLIVSSILSKKLCEGLEGLVMDIKTGNGAFMARRSDAADLGQRICDVAAAAGLPCTALVTDMNQPLASSAGNALEVKEALEFLRGAPTNERLATVTMSLSAELLVTSGLEADPASAHESLRRALASGEAAERFARMTSLQGGPADLLDRPGHYLPTAGVVQSMPAPSEGELVHVDTLAIGLVVRDLGGGRLRAGDPVDPAVGLSDLPRLGERFERGQSLLTIHATNEDAADRAADRLKAAFLIEEREPGTPAGTRAPVVLERLETKSRENANTE